MKFFATAFLMSFATAIAIETDEYGIGITYAAKQQMYFINKFRTQP